MIWSLMPSAHCEVHGGGQPQWSLEHPWWAQETPSNHHLALPSQVQWFSACLVMLSLAVQLVVPNMQGAGLMLPPAMSAQLLASALATMLVL